MTIVPELDAANARFAESFDLGDLSRRPARRVAVVTCMDTRMDPAKILGLVEGDANILRNAGGRADESVLRALFISQQLLGTEEVVVIHHTDCGLLSFTNEQLREICAERLGVDASGIDFLAFCDLKQSVREDVATIRNSPLIPDSIIVSGFIYDVRTGRLEPVD